MKTHDHDSPLVIALARTRDWLEPAAAYLAGLAIPMVLTVALFGRDPVRSMLELVLIAAMGLVAVVVLLQANAIRHLELRGEDRDLQRSIARVSHTWMALAMLHLLLVLAIAVLVLRR